MFVLYIILLFIELMLILAYSLLVKKKEVWMYTLLACTIIALIGYLMISLAPNLDFALFSNKVAYLGSVFLSLSMFMIIVKLCKYSIPKNVTYILIGLSVLMFLIVCTTGYLPWYYKSVEFVNDSQGPKLIKSYGPLYPVYIIYVVGYFIGMITSVVMFSIKHKAQGTAKYAGFMTTAVGVNILVWIGEKFIPLNFEFLTISYLISELMFFFVYWLLQDYIYLKDIPKTVEGKSKIIFVDSKEKAEKLEKIISRLPDGVSLSSRQMDILEGILDGKSRKEIAADLCLSENTVKMHTSSLFKILNVSSREEIFKLIEL